MRLALALVALLFALPVQATTGSASWRSDLQLLVRELPRRHPAPFLNVSRARWDSAATALERRLPSLTRNEALIGFMRLVAMLGDAHTNLEPGPALGLRFYPLELHWFEDGLFVQRADSAHAALVGAQVLRIGRAPVAEAMDAVATIIPHENEWWVRAWGPFQLMIPELLEGLGLASDVERLRLVLERDGHVDTVIVSPAGRIADQHGHGPTPIEMGSWRSMRIAPAPLYEQRPEQALWWTYDLATRTLYVCQRAVVPGPNSATNRAQWDRLMALADSLAPARFVLDIRDNTGGNGGLNRYPVQQLVRRTALDRRDRLFVITGRRTFSAGQQFANLLEAWTQATIVGEPTGQRPSQYGDHRPLPLPASGLTVQISTVFHQAPDEFDRREFVAPRIYTPLDSKSYRDGIDPAMAAILSYGSEPALGEIMARAIAGGDSTAAEQALDAARELPANRYRSLESEVNALGYRFAGERHGEQAIQVFRINTRAYPHSANTYDSLAEALLNAGYREAAIAAYRRAIAVAPGFPPSVRALQELGVN